MKNTLFLVVLGTETPFRSKITIVKKHMFQKIMTQELKITDLEKCLEVKSTLSEKWG